MELPLPQDDRPPSRAPATAHRPGPGRLRPLRQALAAGGLHLPAARRLDGGGAHRARPAGRHAPLPGLGRPHRAAPRRRARCALRPRRRVEHVPPHRRSARRRRVPRLAALLAGGPRPARGAHRREGLRLPSATTWCAPTTRPSPTRRTRKGRGSSPSSSPTRLDDPAAAQNRAAWEVLGRFSKPFLTAFGDADPITRGADARLQQLVPGARGQPHVTSPAAATSSRKTAARSWAGWLTAAFARS